MAKPQYKLPQYNLPEQNRPQSNVPSSTSPALNLPESVHPKTYQPPSTMPTLPKLPYGFSWNQPTSKPDNLFVADYNDPTQINSIVDVLFAKNKLDATVELFKNWINPLTHKDENGQWDPKLGVFMLNGLIHAGEIMDVLANPVKALFIGGVDGFKKSVNWDGTGRYNFDYDLAPGKYYDGILNFALEVVSDPVNIITWGFGGLLKGVAKSGMQAGKSAVKQIVKEATQAGYKAMARDLTEEVAEQIAQEAVEKAIKRTATDFARDDFITKTLKGISDKSARSQKAAELYAQKFRQNLTSYIAHKHGIKDEGLDALIDGLKLGKVNGVTLVDYTLDKASINTIQSLTSVYNFANNADKFIIKAGLTPSGVYPSFLVVKTVPKMWRGVANRIINKKLTAVLSSPIAYKTRDALETVQAIQHELVADKELNKILNTFGRGEITKEELGEIVCVRMAEHIEYIKKSLNNNLNKKDVNNFDIINKWIKENIGYETIDEYISSMLSLKGYVGVDSERRIYELIDLRRTIKQVDANNKASLDYEAKLKTYEAKLKEYDIKIKEPAESLQALEEQKTTLGGHTVAATPQDTIDVGFKVSVDKTDSSFNKASIDKVVTELQRATDITYNKYFKDYIFSQAAKEAHKTAPEAYNILANRAAAAIKLCTTFEEVKAILEAFGKYTTRMRPYVLSYLTEFSDVTTLGTKSPITRVYEAALEVFSGQSGIDSKLYREVFTNFTEDNIKNAIIARAYRSFLKATRNGLIKKERLDFVKKYVNSYIDKLIFKSNTDRIKIIPELKEIMQVYSATLREQVSNVIDGLSDNIHSFSTIESTLNKAVHIDTSEFNETVLKKLTEIDENITLLDKQIKAIEMPKKPVEQRPKTVEEISKEIAKNADDAIVAAEKHIKFIKSIQSSDVVSEDLTKASLEAMHNLPYFKDDTESVIALLNQLDIESLDVKLIQDTKLQKLNRVRTDARYSEEGTYERLREEIDATIQTLSDFASGKSVDFDALQDAYNTLVKVHKGMNEQSLLKQVTQDSQGRLLSLEQQKKYKNSEIKTADGKLRVAYHGTPNGHFNAFDAARQGATDKGMWGKGFYFTFDARKAQPFARGDHGTVLECYINSTNPFYFNNFKSVDEICDYLGVRKPAFQDDESSMFTYSIRDNMVRLNTKHSEAFSKAVVAKGHDAVIVAPFGVDAGDDVASLTEIVVFDANKIEILPKDLSSVSYANETVVSDLAASEDLLAGYLNKIKPERIRTEQVKIAAGAQYLQMKTEQEINIAAYTGNEKLVELIADMCDVTSSTYRLLIQQASEADEYAEYAQQLLAFGENFLQYIKTYDRITQLGAGANPVLTAEELAALRSTLEVPRISQTPITKVYHEDGFSELIEEIQKRLKGYYDNAFKYKKSFAQEKILERNPKLYEPYGWSGVYEHKGDSDAVYTWAIRKEELGLPDEYKHLRPVALDTETVGKAKGDPIYEIGTFDGTTKQRYRRTFKTEKEASLYVPMYSALAKSYAEVPEAERVGKFVADSISDNPLSIKEYYEDFLTRLYADGDDIVLVTHNGDDFDIPGLIAEMEKAEIRSDLLTKFKNTPVLDNLKDFRKNAGYLELSQAKLDAISAVLREHVDNLSLSTSGRTLFFDAGVKSMRDALTEFMDSFANQYGNLAVKGVNERVVGKVVKGEAKASPLLQRINDFVMELREQFTTASASVVSTRAVVDNLPLISKNALAELTPETATPAFKELVEALGTDIHMTRAIYHTPTAMNALGYEVPIDTNVVSDWFIVTSENGYRDNRLMMLYTSLGRHYENIRVKVTNVTQLKDPEFIAKLQEFTKEVQSVKNPNKSSVWTEALRTEGLGASASFVVGLKLYNGVKKYIPAELFEKYKDIIQVLENNNPTQVAKAYNIPTSVLDYTASIKSINDAKDLNEAMFEMELKQGANGIFTAKAQIINNALRRTAEYIQHVQDDIKKFDVYNIAAYKIESHKALDNFCIKQTREILQKSPEELQKYMIYHRAPLMFFNKDTVDLTNLANTVKANEALYKTLNIEFFDTDTMFAIYFKPGTKVDYFVDDLGFHATFNGKQIDIEYDSEFGFNFGEFKRGAELEILFKQMGEITNGQSIGHLGMQLSKENIEEYVAVLPKELQDKLNLDELTKSTMFLGFRFDTMNIGSLASRQSYNQYMPSDITRLVANNNPRIIAKANEKNLMLDYILDPAMRLTEMIKQYGEEVIVNKIKSGDYVVMSVMQDKKLLGKGFHGKGYRVVEFDPSNKKMWELAKNETNRAIIVPKHMYAEFYDKLNTSLLYDNPLYKVAHRIIYLTKLGQILTVGNVFRNVIEAQMKIMIDTKDMLGVIENEFKAVRDLRRYKKAVCDILALSEVDYDKLTAVGIKPADFATKYINNRFEAEQLVQQYYTSLKDVLKMDRAKVFLPDNKKLYFEQINKGGMDEATFDTMHAILTESGTLGKLPAWGKYTLDLHKEKQARFAKEYADDLIGNQMLEKSGSAWQKAYDGMSNFGNLLMTPAQYMDQVARVSQYLTLMDSGFVNSSSALGRVSRTMFNAGIKTDSERLMELAIPFYSFFKHNALYWAEAVEANPWLAKLFFDYLNRLQEESQVGHVSDFEKLNNMSLQNAKLAGNLILTSSNERVVRETRISKNGKPYQVDVTKHDDQVTLKLNFPFMEAYQMASNPLGYLAGATNPAIQLALQTWIGNNPNVPQGVAAVLDTYRPYNFNEGGRADLQWATLIPFVGPVLQKWGPDGYAKKQYEETGFLGNLILPSVFGRLNRFDNVQFANTRLPQTQYKSYRKTGTGYKKSYTVRGYNKQYSGPVKVRTSYTKVKKPKIKTYNPNYYNKYNYSQRAYSNPYNYNKTQTYYTNKSKFYPHRLPRRPRPTVYKLLYNSYGKSRIQYLGLPRTVKNTSLALRKYFSYTK